MRGMNRRLKACPELSRPGHAAVTVLVTASANRHLLETIEAAGRAAMAPHALEKQGNNLVSNANSRSV